MTNKLALATSMAMPITISGQAFAETAVLSDKQAVYAFNASGRAVVVTDRGASNARHYYGGPKSND
jgi:hypothetical protein